MRPITSLLATSAAIFGLVAAPAFAADTYTFNADHTFVGFEYNHFGFSHMNAKFMNIAGTVTLDQVSPANSSVAVSFTIDGLNTGVAKLDADLKAPNFFDAAKYPNVTFKSTQVVLTGATTADVTGDLTLHGVTKPVTLHVTLNKISDDKAKAGFSATGSLLRSDFGITTFLPMVPDQVDLTIEAEAKK